MKKLWNLLVNLFYFVTDWYCFRGGKVVKKFVFMIHKPEITTGRLMIMSMFPVGLRDLIRIRGKVEQLNSFFAISADLMDEKALLKALSYGKSDHLCEVKYDKFYQITLELEKASGSCEILIEPTYVYNPIKCIHNPQLKDHGCGFFKYNQGISWSWIKAKVSYVHITT